MKVCSCKRERAIYFCDCWECPNRESQPYYCDECAEQSEGRHAHAPKKIVRETQLHLQEWTALDQATAKFNHYGVLIRYLEKASLKMPVMAKKILLKSLTGDFTRLKQLH